MFTITLYITMDEVNRVTKRLSNGIQLTGSLRNETEIIRPTVLIESPLNVGYNYCYIESFGRYYYITDKKSVRNGIIELYLEVDPLMSFSSKIKNTPAIIDKQASLSNANMYIDDGDWIIQNNEWIQILDFPSGFNNEGEFILIAAGGGANSL